jgi:hypothetical protein
MALPVQFKVFEDGSPTVTTLDAAYAHLASYMIIEIYYSEAVDECMKLIERVKSGQSEIEVFGGEVSAAYISSETVEIADGVTIPLELPIDLFAEVLLAWKPYLVEWERRRRQDG